MALVNIRQYLVPGQANDELRYIDTFIAIDSYMYVAQKF